LKSISCGIAGMLRVRLIAQRAIASPCSHECSGLGQFDVKH